MAPLSSGSFRTVAHSLKLGDNSISMIALDFDTSVLDRSSGAKPGFQLGRKLGKAVLVQR
jgi:hypothetical protein